MRLSDSPEIETLVPTRYPPERLVSVAQREIASSLESELLMRSYLWANAIITAGFQSSILLENGLSHFSAGYTAVNREALGGLNLLQVSGFTFGGYLLIRGDEQNSRVTMLRIGEQAIPFVINYGNLDLHGCPPHPLNGSAACWAINKSLRYQAWKYGIITCRHVVDGLPLGSNITLTPSNDHNYPQSATVQDRDEFTIDAAILDVGSTGWSSHLGKMTVQSPSAPGQSIEFTDRGGSTIPGSVLRVFYFPTYAGNLFGQRVIADCFGQPGDSGSLLTVSGTGNGVGIYMGTIPDGHGGTEGIFQDLAQVRDYFELELYH